MAVDPMRVNTISSYIFFTYETTYETHIQQPKQHMWNHVVSHTRLPCFTCDTSWYFTCETLVSHVNSGFQMWWPNFTCDIIYSFTCEPKLVSHVFTHTEFHMWNQFGFTCDYTYRVSHVVTLEHLCVLHGRIFGVQVLCTGKYNLLPQKK